MDGVIPPSISGTKMAQLKYDSVQGHLFFEKILAKYVTYDPHDYILDGLCPVVDGFNLLATTPTDRIGKNRVFDPAHDHCS